MLVKSLKEQSQQLLADFFLCRSTADTASVSPPHSDTSIHNQSLMISKSTPFYVSLLELIMQLHTVSH